MAAKKTRAGVDVDAVTRLMQQAEDDAEPVAVAPAAPLHAPAPTPAPTPRPLPPGVDDPGKVDGRTLRRTGREPFATRIRPETHETLRRIAYARGLSLAEVVELAVAAFDKKDA